MIKYFFTMYRNLICFHALLLVVTIIPMWRQCNTSQYTFQLSGLVLEFFKISLSISYEISDSIFTFSILILVMIASLLGVNVSVTSL